MVLVKVSVTDTGVGIPAERIDRLFRAFSQVDASNTREFGGTGLGLVIAKRIVELHGGEIGVKSRLGAGSEFWFTARLRRSAQATEAPAHEARRLAVPVVDDNATNRRILRYHLERYENSVVEAEDGPRALEVLRSAAAAGLRFDVGVIDFQMPGLDGIELAEAIQADPSLAGLPLALLTSAFQQLSQHELRQRGIGACLTKPVRPSDLLSCVAEIVGRAPRQRTSPRTDSTASKSLLSTEIRARKRILVVEDNVVNQKVTARQLQKMGFRCELAADGQEAIRWLERFPFDLVLMDCQMPVLDGFEATRAIREKEKREGQRIPIIALTANAMQEDEERCLRAGMDDYLAKPIVYEKLVAMVGRWLEQGATERKAG